MITKKNIQTLLTNMRRNGNLDFFDRSWSAWLTYPCSETAPMGYWFTTMFCIPIHLMEPKLQAISQMENESPELKAICKELKFKNHQLQIIHTPKASGLDERMKPSNTDLFQPPLNSREKIHLTQLALINEDHNVEHDMARLYAGEYGGIYPINNVFVSNIIPPNDIEDGLFAFSLPPLQTKTFIMSDSGVIIPPMNPDLFERHLELWKTLSTEKNIPM